METDTRHGAKHPEELDLLRKTKTPHEPTSPRRPSYCFRGWKRLALLDDLRRRRRQPRCVVCLQVHQVSGLPASMDGRALAVGWRTRGWRGELTLPVHVRGGSAAFEEIFLHYRDADIRDTLQGFTVWVSLVDAGDCDLGTFEVDPGGLVSEPDDAERHRFGGKSVALDLSGVAKGAVLRVTVYYRVVDGELSELQKPRGEQDGAGHEQRSRCRCFPCLPQLRHRRTRPLTVSARRMPSLKSDPGFITIENAAGAVDDTYPLTDDEDESFITIEKGVVRARSRRPPSSNSFDTGDGGGDGGGDAGSADPFLGEGVAEEFDVDRVEDEFLRMLEEKSQGKEGEVTDPGMNLKLSFDLDMDLETLVKAAEVELGKAAKVWRSRWAAGVVLEKEEHEELVRRWRAGGQLPSSCRSFGAPGSGFGSPI